MAGTTYLLDETGLAYFWGKITAKFAPKTSLSHVGMIIQSTTLDTKAKVIAVYGGTDWIRHKGYFLRGADNNDTVVDNQAQSDGGSATHNHGAETGSITLTAAQSGLPSHGHTYTRPTVSSSGTCSITSSGGHTHAVKYHSDNTTGGKGARLGGSSDTSTAAAIASDTGKHTHTVPNHTHTLTGGGVANASGRDASQGHAHSISSADNLPPYKNVYIWERTA